jgi:predicted ester cyclase
MSPDVNKTVVRRLYEEVFEAGRLELADELVDPDARDARDAQDRRGPGRVKEVAAMLRAAFPDQHWDIKSLVAEGDAVVMRCTHSGTHQGPFMNIAPTGRTFRDVDHAYFFELRDGKITSYHAIRDDLGMLRQLEVIR